MHIDQFQDTIMNCRFCFMCRHLSGTGNVTCHEADTPRIRAAMIYRIQQKPEELANADFIKTVYASDMSAACTFHCVSHYQETALLRAVRADIVDAGLAPENVQAIAGSMEKSAEWTVSGQAGDVLWFEDLCTAATPEISQSFAAVAQKAKIEYRTISGGSIGKALYVLGYDKKAAAIAEKFAKFINGLNAKTLVVSNPAAYDAFVNDFPAFGVKLDVKVMHSSEFFAGLNLNFSGKTAPLFYLESDYLKNYNNAYKFPAELLKQIGAELLPFGSNNEESYSAGEGALVLRELDEKLVRMLAERVASREPGIADKTVVTASPYTRAVLARYTALNVISLEELAASAL